jgi:hypothetical protein
MTKARDLANLGADTADLATDAEVALKAPINNPTFTGTVTAEGLTVDGNSLAMHINSAGDVGIGTNNPYSRQHIISGNTDFVGSVGAGIEGIQLSRDTSRGENLYLYTSSGQGWSGSTHVGRLESYGNNALEIGTQQNVPISFGTGNVERMCIDSSGNVSISQAFVGNAELKIDVPSAANRATFGIQVETDYARIQSYGTGSSLGHLSLNPLGNNVGIGTTSPTGKLHIYGGRLVMDNTADSQSALQFNQAGTEMGVLYRPSNVTNQLRMFLTGSGDTMTWSSNGHVGIGTVSPSAKLDVVGNIKVSGTSHYGNFGSATFSWDGSTGYPTLFSDHQDRWVMITNPHVPFLANGVRGHTGGNLGSVIQFEGSTTGDQSQKVGVYTGYEGQLCMGPTNNSTPSIRVNNQGTVYLQERKVTGNLRRFQKYIAASPSVTTDRLLTYSRGWWGSGNVRIKLYANYYGPSSQYIEHAINGHTDTRYGGAAPSLSTVINDGGGTGGTTGTLAATNWDQTNGVADIEITLDGYRQVLVVVEAMTTVHGDRAGTYGDGNSSIWLDSFTEIL